MSYELSLIETFFYHPIGGFINLDYHLNRIRSSAIELNFCSNLHNFEEFIYKNIEKKDISQRIRLELFKDGRLKFESADFIRQPADMIWTIAISSVILDQNNHLYNHKLSSRDIYNKARAEISSEIANEVILFNQLGNLADGTITSVFIDKGCGKLITPPLSAGALRGILRQKLLDENKAIEQQITLMEIEQAANIYVGNSLRGLIKAKLLNKKEIS